MHCNCRASKQHPCMSTGTLSAFLNNCSCPIFWAQNKDLILWITEVPQCSFTSNGHGDLSLGENISEQLGARLEGTEWGSGSFWVWEGMVWICRTECWGMGLGELVEWVWETVREVVEQEVHWDERKLGTEAETLSYFALPGGTVEQFSLLKRTEVKAGKLLFDSYLSKMMLCATKILSYSTFTLSYPIHVEIMISLKKRQYELVEKRGWGWEGHNRQSYCLL